jgi:hypothetical protein
VRARVRATNGDTAELLRDHESHLRDALRAAGIRVAELDVNDGGARRGALEPKPRGRAAAGRGPSATESDSHAAPAVNSEPLDVLV